MKTTSKIDLEEFVNSLNHSEKLKLSSIVSNYFSTLTSHDDNGLGNIISFSEFVSNNPGIA